MNTILNQLIQRLDQIITDYPAFSLYDPIKYTLLNGGKRIRPCLVVESAIIFGKKIDNDLLDVALAVEVFHNFTLVHDDIMDNAALRRGKASVYKKWGVNTAILSGDAMLIEAYQLLNNTSKTKELLAVFNHNAILVCHGQMDDMEFEQREEVLQSEYIQMITNKTAVLLGASMQMGAILGGASIEAQEHLYEFGKNLGIAFQLQDDILDLYADDKFGKVIGGDILANKKTILMILASESQSEIQAIIKSSEISNDEKVKKVKAIFDNHNIKQKAQHIMQEYYDEAIKNIDFLDKNHDISSLKSFATQVFNREY